MNEDMETIAAVSTPVGFGGIAIVRLSGAGAFAAAEKIVDRSVASLPSHSIARRRAVYMGEAVDEVLVTKMKAPKTYTREDVVEINCHGGFMAAQKVLEAALAAGARLAEPGEFTKRAFFNGRIDLSQAEAVSDIVNAATDGVRAAAFRQLSGSLSSALSSAREKALSLASRIEANIEYPEYEEADFGREELRQGLDGLLEEAEALLRDFRRSETLREGFRAVLCGKPNVGKSLLLNTLTNKDKAIVTEFAGTTRDIVDEAVNLDGLAVRFYDTAGIRGTLDPIEKMGVERSLRAMGEGDAALFVVDASCPLDSEDEAIWAMAQSRASLVILNKSDLGALEEVRARFAGFRTAEASALTGEGIEGIYRAVKELAGYSDASGFAFLSNMRHRKALEGAALAAREAIASLGRGVQADLIAIDIRAYLSEIGKITGETAAEDVIDEVFREFCLGK
jgi:tRNA modification GTPase